MKIPADVRAALGSSRPGVPFQMRTPEDAATTLGRPRNDVAAIVKRAHMAGMVQKVDGSSNSWILKPDEPLPAHLIKVLILDHQANPNWALDPTFNQVLARVDDIPEIDRDDVTAWVTSVGGEIQNRVFPEVEDLAPIPPGGEFPNSDFTSAVDFYVVPADALIG